MRASLAVLVLLLAAAGCSSDEEPDAAASSDAAPSTGTTSTASASTGPVEPTTGPVLRDAVVAYSDAFLTGDAPAAFDLLSARCQGVIGEAAFTAVVEQAGDLYGAPLELVSYDEQVSGDTALVSYTYDATALDQSDEPWLVERGEWRNDDC